MKPELQLEKAFPSISGKHQPLSSVFNMIKLKKAELSKELHQFQTFDVSLPIINHQKNQSDRIKEYSQSNLDDRINQSQLKSQKNQYSSPSNKYKTILDNLYPQQKQTKKTPTENTLLRSKIISKSKIQDSIILQIQNKNIRTRTETKTKQYRKLTQSNHHHSIHKNKKEDQTIINFDQHIKKFCQCIENIPKNMKLRNEENLSQTIQQLQHFNPFFNRNQRIINICLLKMGKIQVKVPPLQLYKSGDLMDHFYIILCGKIKIAQGSFRRVCQTGETVLQQILFSEKSKKIAYERAKVICPTYLLELKTDEFKKIKEQLIRYGLKLGFQQMESIIKRNYIVKNWMRNKKRLDTNK